MKIEKIEIKGLFGKKDICWKLNPQVNVLVGVNGSGKSTILSTIYCMLRNILNSNKSMIFDISEIHFFDNEIEPIIRKNQTRIVNIDETIAENIAGELEKIISAELINKLSNIENKKVKEGIFKSFENFQPKLKEKLFHDIQEKIINDAQEIDGRKALILPEVEQIYKNKEIFEKFIVTMISTLNLSANAIFEFKGSNEEVLNILDLEMDKVLNEFNYKSDDEIQTKLMNALNFFLNTVQKHAEYKNHFIVYFDKDIQKELKFSDLSSGERQLVYMLVQVALNSTEKEKSSIILMDEPEISLHMDWQEHFISQLISLSPNSQFIIVTHSPALIMNGWNAAYLDIEEITK